MSQQSPLPPPVDWMRLRYGPAPVGAYGPAPGPAPAMTFTMSKPRNLTWLQTLL